MFSPEESWGIADNLGWPLICIATSVFLILAVLLVVGIIRRVRGRDPLPQRNLCFTLSAWIGLVGIVTFGGKTSGMFLRLAMAQHTGGMDYGNIFIRGAQAHSRLATCALVALIGVTAGLFLSIIKKTDRQQVHAEATSETVPSAASEASDA